MKRRELLTAGIVVCLGVLFSVLPTPATAQRSDVRLESTDRHVPELARYLERLQLSEPVVYRQFAVYTMQLIDGDTLSGGWLTMDSALSRGVLVITEKGAGGSVPVVQVENRSRDQHIFIMSGEVLAGGKQTRTVRKDVVLAPGQKVDLKVFCVEKHRWHGGGKLSAGNAMLPQSISKELRKGADQKRVWSEVARNNRALGAENATGSLERALKSKPVQDKLAEVKRRICPEIPRGTVGFIFVHRGRAVGAEYFGREDLATAMLPKLVESYAVDFVLQHKHPPRDEIRRDHSAAIAFYNRVRRVGSQRADTPGSGAGIRTRADRLLGDGVSLGGVPVHYGIQIHDRIIPPPKPVPIIPRRQWDNRQEAPRR